LRAAAALGVTCTHIVGYEFVRQYQLPEILPAFPIGNFGVDVFFVISGFVMVYASEPYFGRPRGSQEFFLRRLARIVPLYWATTTIILVYLILQYHDLTAVNFTPASVLASYLFIPVPQTDGFMAPVHGVGWTLNYEMFFYACFSAAVLFSLRIGVVALALALLCLVALKFRYSAAAALWLLGGTNHPGVRLRDDYWPCLTRGYYNPKRCRVRVGDRRHRCLSCPDALGRRDARGAMGHPSSANCRRVCSQRW
jgi:peptidoglycan/LPS O-acetylase OafA/YrhL